MRPSNFLASVRCAALTAVAVVLLVGCSNSTNSSEDAMTSSSPFADSEFVSERLGMLTERDLSPQVSEPTRTAVVNSLNNFSFDMHRAVSSASPNSGSVESGFSAALALLLSSAATAGNTQSELFSLLGMDALDEDDVHAAINELSQMLDSRTNDDLILHTANRVFVKPGLDLQTPFLDRATAEYGAPVVEANFAEAPEEVVSAVNGWVSDQTNGFIPRVVNQLDPNTVFALLNAIFLDATWRDEYEGVDEQPFNNIDGTVTSVAGFTGRSELPLLVRDDLTALEIPYGGDELAMLIMMPNTLSSLETSLNAQVFEEIVGALEVDDVQFTAPSWKQSAEFDLVQLLSPLGLPANPWNFSRLASDSGSLDVLANQVARIEVDENGTRAAAATIIAGATSLPLSVTIDRPFIYALRDRATGAVLFTGRVVMP